MDFEPKKQTIYKVKLGNQSICFEKLEDASSFFAKVVEAPRMRISREGYSQNEYIKEKGRTAFSIEQEDILLYNDKKSYDFAHSEDKK